MEFSELAAAGLPTPERKSEILAASIAAFPAYPGEDCLAHDAQLYQEQVEARFASRSLLVVAQGGSPPAANAIIDVDLSKLHCQHHTETSTEERRSASKLKRKTSLTNAAVCS